MKTNIEAVIDEIDCEIKIAVAEEKFRLAAILDNAKQTIVALNNVIKRMGL